jgi:hypothetical protein
MGVMALVAPGPDVTINTPGLPEMRAYLRVRCDPVSLPAGLAVPDACCGLTTHAKVNSIPRTLPPCARLLAHAVASKS